MSGLQRVLVVSGDVLPLPGYPTSGAGLRAWGLGQGLRANGFEVEFSMPRVAWRAEVALPALDFALRLWEPNTMDRMVRECRAEAVVFCHWPSTLLQRRLDVPTIVDFHGPHILERFFQHDGDIGGNAVDKIGRLRLADCFLCPAEKQRPYFWAWLLLSGFDVASVPLEVVPVCLSPDLPLHTPPDEPEFVFGGVYLPWQDPTVGLTTLAHALTAHNRGRLSLFGGPHPNYPIKVPPQFEKLERELAANPRVRFNGLRPNAELIERYRCATVALDLMRRNPERELAFTTRTVEYLWCGLPVIYNNYAELSAPIREYDAGWALDPEDQAGLRRAIEECLDMPETIRVKSLNAQRLVRERLTWDKAVQPLVAYLRDPQRHTPGLDFPAYLAQELGERDVWQRLGRRSLRSMWRTARKLYTMGGPGFVAKETVNFLRREILRR